MKKKVKFFYNNLAVQGVIIYFTADLNELYFNKMV